MNGLLELNAPPILLAAWGGGFSWTAAVIAGIAVAAVVVVVATPLVLAGGITIFATGLMAAALGVAAGTAAGYWFTDSKGPESGNNAQGPAPPSGPKKGPAQPLTKIEISFPPSPESPDQARPFFCRITETRGDGASPISEEITAASTSELRKKFERKLAEIIPSSSTPRLHVEARIYTQPFPGQPIIDEFSRLVESKGLKPDLVASPPPP